MECCQCGSKEDVTLCPFSYDAYCEDCIMLGQDEARKEINAEFDRIHALEASHAYQDWLEQFAVEAGPVSDDVIPW